MTTPEIAAFSFVVLLTLFTLGVGIRSLGSGRVCLVPGNITRKERFAAWLTATVVQVFTGSALAIFCFSLYKALMAGK